MKHRIALVVSHPIQHFCPQYVSFARNSDVVFKVYFGSALGLKKYYDPNFKNEISWANLKLDQFDHCFLNGDEVLPSDGKLDAPSLDKELSSFQPDVIIIYGYYQKIQRRAHRWALVNKVKLAYISDSELRHSRSRWKELIKFYFIRNYFSKIDYFLSVGDANEEFYQRYGVPIDKMIRMHFPIDLSQFDSRFAERDSLRSLIRNKYNIPDDQLILSVVGKLVPWKNQDHIIKALQLLEKEGIYMCLFILGSGEMLEPWKSKSRELKNSIVHFTGFVNPEELPAYYAATDIYVHPASVEPHSIAISEAIYMGCPVVISDRCGSYGEADDVQENRNGFVYPFGEFDKLANSIKLLVENRTLRVKFGEYSAKISREFQKNAHVDILTKLVAVINRSTV